MNLQKQSHKQPRKILKDNQPLDNTDKIKEMIISNHKGRAVCTAPGGSELWGHGHGRRGMPGAGASEGDLALSISFAICMPSVLPSVWPLDSVT